MGVSGVLLRKRWMWLIRSRRAGRSPTVSGCTLPLRLLKHHLFMPHKDAVTNLPLFLENTLELLMVPLDPLFFNFS